MRTSDRRIAAIGPRRAPGMPRTNSPAFYPDRPEISSGRNPLETTVSGGWSTLSLDRVDACSPNLEKLHDACLELDIV